MSVAKKKRVSKKTKLAWRKHVNIQDVENFLEEQRLEERLGKPVTEKTNEELFIVDTNPIPTPELTSKQKRRVLLRERLPKCFSMLQPHTEVPDPVVKRNRVRTKEERKSALIKKKEEVRKLHGILKAKELQSQKDRKLHEIKKNSKTQRIEFNDDIWNLNEESSNDLVSEWIESGTKKHTLRGIGKLPKTIPKSIQIKHSVLPAVVPPHPGTSYNPSFADHQALLQTVAEKEEKMIKEESHLNRVTRGMFSKVSPAEKQKAWVIEMSEGLEKNNQDEKEEGEYKTVNPPVQNKKKNLKQRRKQKEQQQLEQAKKSAKKEKKKVADIYKLKFLKKQIDQNEKKVEKLRSKRLKKKALQEKEPKRLGLIKFEEQEFDFNMPQDISGNLRNIKKEGSLLTDRFKSLQKRNILEPTTIRNRTFAKIKRFKKSGHKDDWKVTVARASNKLR